MVIYVYYLQNSFGAKVNPSWPPSSISSNGFPQPINGSQHIIQQPTQQAPTSGVANQPLSGPPGVPPLSAYAQQRQPQQPQSFSDQSNTNPSNASAGTSSTNPAAAQQTQSSVSGSASSNPAHPQTPAQQLVLSPADRWGLLGLLALIKGADPDTALLAFGADVGSLGLPVGQSGYVN